MKNAKPSGYYFYMNLNIWGDFQIRISVPLNHSVVHDTEHFISEGSSFMVYKYILDF